MINFKNILKVLLIAFFVCAWNGAGTVWAAEGETTTSKDTQKYQQQNPVEGMGSNSEQDASFCNTSYGIFGGLVKTGQEIFNRLRDLIYVVAGFGIIAVAVGGFFGNLNWKWLGAIVISLVVIATAGELIVLMTGCKTYGSSLITNTLQNPTATMTTDEYNKAYTNYNGESNSPQYLGAKINWSDEQDVLGYSNTQQKNENLPAEGKDS